MNQADARHLIDLYDASIRQMDDGIAWLVQLLKDKIKIQNELQYEWAGKAANDPSVVNQGTYAMITGGLNAFLYALEQAKKIELSG